MRDLPAVSPFAADDGAPDPALAAVLADWAQGAAGPAQVLATLAVRRVLLPVLPHPVGGAPGGEAGCRDVTAGVVGLAGPHGRTAMPAFTGLPALAAWRGDARPVPVAAPHAAASALAEGWPVLVLDPAGPVRFVCSRPMVQALAAGEPWRPVVAADGRVDEVVAEAVRTALHGVLGVLRATAEPGERAELAVRLHVPADLDRVALQQVAARANAALVAEPTLAARVDSVELRVVAG